MTRARFEPATVVAVVATTAWYLREVRRLRRDGGYWSPRRTLSFLLAEALVAVAVLSGLAAYAPTNFSAFGTEYILAVITAPGLFALAAPVTLARRRRVEAGRASAQGGRLLAVLTNPLLTWPLFAASMFVLFYGGLLRPSIHDAATQQVVFLALIGAGFLFYWPVVAVDPRPWSLGYWPRILYLLLIFPAWAILGMTLESQGSGLVTGISAASLHLGGAVIWVAGETSALIGAVAVFAQWLRADERSARRHDADNEAAAARQLALWRASRDAAARAASN